MLKLETKEYRSVGQAKQMLPVLHTEGLSVRYNGTTVLEDVSLRIPQGEIFAIIGPSGCGKSSFLSTLNRLSDEISGCSVGGRIEFHGENILAPHYDVIGLRRRVGMIFQKPTPFPLSIRENIEIGLKHCTSLSTAARREKVDQVLTDVGLWPEVCNRLHDPAQSLSGGQQQRLCIARCIALEPEIILLDEPCSALDPVATERVERLLLSLAGRFTIVVVTHNLAQARRISSHTAFFWNTEGVGGLYEVGTTGQLFQHPQRELTAAYLCGLKG